MTSAPIRAFGIALYRREDYPRILQVMEDANKLPTTYDDWIQKAEKLESDSKRGGMVVVRAVIDPDKFSGWCAIRGMKIDAQARIRFANETAAEKIRSGDGG